MIFDVSKLCFFHRETVYTYLQNRIKGSSAFENKGWKVNDWSWSYICFPNVLVTNTINIFASL